MKILVFGGGSDIAKEIQRKEKNTVLVEHSLCDITKPDGVASFIKAHKPEVVINCAGIIEEGFVKDQKFLDWESQIKTNLAGSFTIAQACIKNNVKKIIFIGSVMGLYGRSNYSAYSASKAGVISLTQSLGMEGIDAYCISPGGVDTKMREKAHPGEDKKMRLSPTDVVTVMFDCINGKYLPGDNIILRKKNFRKIIEIDRGQPWKEYLHIH